MLVQSGQSKEEMERSDALLAAQLAEYGDTVLHGDPVRPPGADLVLDMTGDEQAGVLPAQLHTLGSALVQ